MKIIVLAAAELDLEEVFEHYRLIDPKLAADFITEFRRGIDKIIQFPRGWQLLDSNIRRYRLSRFPYGIDYRLDESAGEIVVSAIRHLHRMPRGR